MYSLQSLAAGRRMAMRWNRAEMAGVPGGVIVV